MLPPLARFTNTKCRPSSISAAGVGSTVLVTVTSGEGLEPGPSEPVDGPPVTAELPLEQATRASTSTSAAAGRIQRVRTGQR